MSQCTAFCARFILAALVLFVGCSRPASPPFDPKRITYIDATDGPTGNTRLATGKVLTAVTPNPIGNDSQWSKRKSGIGGTVFTANDGTPPGPEDAPGLVTTIFELEPETKYRVFAYYWTDQHDWQLKASLREKPPLKDDPSTAFSKIPAIVRKAGTQAKSADFAGPLMLKETNRQLLQADLGEIAADADGRIQVWIDDRANAHHSNRTWYDGVGVSVGPPPGYATMRPSLVPWLIVALLAVATMYVAASAFKKRRKPLPDAGEFDSEAVPP